MENERSLIKSGSNGLFLAVAGAVVLVAKGILFAGPIEYLVAGAAAIWGGYILLTDRTRRKAGWASLAGAGVLVLLGGVLQAGAAITGIGLIAAGAVSFFSGLFRRRGS